MNISVVIPTCNRKDRLISLLGYLEGSLYPLREVIIVDSGEDRLSVQDLESFSSLPIQYIQSEKSVCIQRNKGIQLASSEWIFLCDDDIEVPPDYLQKLAAYSDTHPDAGALSGLVLQKEENTWNATYKETSARMLYWKYVFKLSIWGEINCRENVLVKKIKAYYQRKGNFISKAGWPVITDFSGDHFITPVYGLGASVIRRSWLLQSPYAEVLDKHGIGDNYGVAADFPVAAIHVLKQAAVYHHQEPDNRLQRPVQYFRRVLALDYFRRTKQTLQPVKKYWLLWSLAGNLLAFIWTRDRIMIKPAFKVFCKIAFNNNPYYKGAKSNKKVLEPML